MVGIAGALEIVHVTGVALGGEPLEPSRGCTFVAGLAIHRRMSADEREAILVVANRCDGNFPAFDGVAGFAVRAKLAAMDIRMAVRALLANIRENQFDVALRALHFLVHAAKWVTRFVVVKFGNTADGFPTQ